MNVSNKVMKVSFIMNFYPRVPVGGMKVIHEYANYLAKQGDEVTLYYYYSAEFVSEKYHLPEWCRLMIMKWRIEHRKIKWFKLHKKIRKIGIREICDQHIEDADVVIATAVSTAEPVAKLSNEKGRKIYLIQGYENWATSDENVNKTYTLGMTNIVIANWLKTIVDKYSVTPAVLISNAIDTKIFNVKKAIEERKKHTIVFQYRDAEYKGGKYVLETIRVLEHIYPDLKVDVISTDNRPDNLPQCCLFHKNLTPEQVSEINNNAQIFLCGSIEEGFGLPGLEAMACGCALVSTKYRGVLEYAVDRDNALLSPIRDSEAMAKNVIELFENKKLLEQIVQNGLKTVKTRKLEIAGKMFYEEVHRIR